MKFDLFDAIDNMGVSFPDKQTVIGVSKTPCYYEIILSVFHHKELYKVAFRIDRSEILCDDYPIANHRFHEAIRQLEHLIQ